MITQLTAWRLGAALIFIVLITGCTSTGTVIVRNPPANPTKLGRVEGTATGAVCGLFPIAANSRTERAYAAALAKAPGATALMDVTLRENWYAFYLGTLQVVTISGEAVK